MYIIRRGQLPHFAIPGDETQVNNDIFHAALYRQQMSDKHDNIY